MADPSSLQKFIKKLDELMDENLFLAMKQKPLLLAQEAPAPQITEVARLGQGSVIIWLSCFYAFS